MVGKWLNCLMLPASCYLLVIFLCRVLSDETANEGPKCKTLFTFGYGYRQFFHLSPSSIHLNNGDLIFMKFMVKARSDAHILLSPTPSPEEGDPVYEIVLGAGKNSFSDIRRRRRAATKSSAYTKDILSGTELKGFWVKIDNKGIIQVGNENDDLPFMQWQDPDPLLIEYFSFCTWSGVAGKWLYDCSSNEEAGTIAVTPNHTATDKLRQALLKNYDIYSRPVVNSSQLLKINIEMEANYVMIDARKSAMTVGCVFRLVWYDEKLVWNPSMFSNLSSLNLIHHEIWQPELINFNAVGKGISPLGKASMLISSDGKVRWSPNSYLQTRCHLDLQKWPWDTQKCSVQLGFWNEADMLHLMLIENGTKMQLQKTGSEWVVLKIEAESIIVKRPWIADPSALSSDDSDSADDDTSNPTSLSITFTLKRINYGYFYIFVIPVIVIIIMSLACCWMDPMGKEKLATNCLLLLLLCGFLFSLESNLPAPADHTPYIFKAYSWVLMAVCCTTMITVLITNLVRTAHHRSLPQFMFAALTSHLMSSLFCLPKPKPVKDYGKLNETEERAECLSLVSYTYESSSITNCWDNECGANNYSWTLLAVFCDRISFISALMAYTTILLL